MPTESWGRCCLAQVLSAMPPKKRRSQVYSCSNYAGLQTDTLALPASFSADVQQDVK